MLNHGFCKIESILGLKELGWMMSPSERFAVLGILSAMRPRTTLELGCADGGQTQWLSQYSEKVISVDFDPKIYEAVRSFPNVKPLCMVTSEAWKLFSEQELRFDLTIIDADHSEKGVFLDLQKAIQCSEVILIHDSYHPPCRRGMISALRGTNIYFDLDFVPGGIQRDGLWGGLCIVLPNVSKTEKNFTTPRLSNYAWCYFIFLSKIFFKTFGSAGTFLATKTKRAVSHLLKRT